MKGNLHDKFLHRTYIYDFLTLGASTVLSAQTKSYTCIFYVYKNYDGKTTYKNSSFSFSTTPESKLAVARFYQESAQDLAEISETEFKQKLDNGNVDGLYGLRINYHSSIGLDVAIRSGRKFLAELELSNDAVTNIPSKLLLGGFGVTQGENMPYTTVLECFSPMF